MRRYRKKFSMNWRDGEIYQFRDVTPASNMKVAPSRSKLREIKHSRVPNEFSINSASSRFSRPSQNVLRVTSQRGSCECTFVTPGSITDSSRFWFVAFDRVYYMLHTQGMRFSRARSARTQFFTFPRSSLRTRERRLALTGGVLSGTHRLGRAQR